jgi:hypothetical protein
MTDEQKRSDAWAAMLTSIRHTQLRKRDAARNPDSMKRRVKGASHALKMKRLTK